ncbi:Transcriptional regulator, GntR family [Candidatus Sulfotelmatobacter kueseliae]|uniref:Transcriptional regulator, GntR family n=1 Tax=Candidatus Sulfotelmatobacter kueseliae TaxID=2042962 RepID=A0A2U3LC93_9BACT|nr:Transcriptional regulator, GntR family [Candidatus Sulfotelmatobacter kueseliae]
MGKSTTNGAGFEFALDLHTGVPVYRQLIDQVRAGVASGTLTSGDQLPTVRQLAVDLAINPNTVMRAYRELELGGLLETHQGTGTFIANKKVEKASAERERQLSQMASEVAARAGAAGFTVEDLIDRLRELLPRPAQRR